MSNTLDVWCQRVCPCQVKNTSYCTVRQQVAVAGEKSLFRFATEVSSVLLHLGLRQWLYRLNNRFQRRSLLSPLQHCWRQSAVSILSDSRELEFMVIDAEMSSLNYREGELLSIGWVLATAEKIQLNSAQHYLFSNEAGVGQSATIHAIRDSDLRAGLGAREVMDRLLQQAAGKVLVFHHAGLDLAYLNRICRQLYGAPLLLPTIDTLQIERRILHHREQLLESQSLRLDNCRQRYGLPPYPAHDALTDALATAELLLAQLAHKGSSVKLGSLLRW